jgi:hypothetical protein
MSWLSELRSELPPPVIWSEEYTMQRWDEIHNRPNPLTEVYAAALGVSVFGAIYFTIMGFRILFAIGGII